MTVRPLLTIAIPTYRRSHYLDIQLRQLGSELTLVPPGAVEVIVSDNCSDDATPQVVQAALARGMQLRSLRNATNIGSDRNTAQCFNEASGEYVIIMGDDDVLLDGVLAVLLEKLRARDAGVVLLRPFGYDRDFRAEAPSGTGYWQVYRDPADFLQRAGALITLISACVIHKAALEPLDATQFCGGHLVQVHLVLRALLQAPCSASYEAFAVACKRNNSGGYEFSQVFVHELGTILDSYIGAGLTNGAVRNLESRLLIGYYPYYVWRQLRFSPQQLNISRQHFERRFSGRWQYHLLVQPLYTLPRPLAWAWGAAATAVGRAASGDLRRGWAFLLSQAQRMARRPAADRPVR
jgi:abequosyltransferase